MKKFLATMIFVFSVFALVSCGGSDGKTHCEDSNDDSCNYKACAKEAAKHGMNTTVKSTNVKAAVQLLTVLKRLRQSLWIAWDSKKIWILNS